MKTILWTRDDQDFRQKIAEFPLIWEGLALVGSYVAEFDTFISEFEIFDDEDNLLYTSLGRFRPVRLQAGDRFPSDGWLRIRIDT